MSPFWFALLALTMPLASPGEFVLTGPMANGRDFGMAAPLDDGRVLVAGGSHGEDVLGSAELYDPASGFFTDAGSTHEMRKRAAAAPLPDGSVLIAGGYQPGWGVPPTATAERFAPALRDTISTDGFDVH